MEVETTRHYNDGFVLTEQSLRRLLDVIKEQIHKLGDARAIATRLKFRFLNGAIATSDSIEDLFKQENGGQAQIVDLNIEFKEDPGNDPIVSIRFSNPRVNLGRSSISVEIRGDSRDWVFVTGSLIDERIQQTKRSTLLTKIATASVSTAGLVIFMIMFGGFTIASNFESNSMPGFPKFRNKIRTSQPFSQMLISARNKGQIKDAVDALIYLEVNREKIKNEAERDSIAQQQKFDDWEKQREEAHRLENLIPWKSIILPGLIVFIVIIGPILFLRRFYPLYNFCWGDYGDVFRRKEATLRFVFASVLLALVLSIIGSVIANQFGRGGGVR